MLDIERDGRLEALRVALQDARGFTLMFVEVQIGPGRDELMTHLRSWSGRDDVPRLHFAHVGVAEKPFDVLSELHLTRGERVGVVMTGLEQFLIGSSLAPAIHGLNLARDLLSRVVPGPLVIVAEEDLLRAISEQFPDLYSWRSFETRVKRDEAPEEGLLAFQPRPFATEKLREEYRKLRDKLSRAKGDLTGLRLAVALAAHNVLDTEEMAKQLDLSKHSALAFDGPRSAEWRFLAGLLAMHRSQLEGAQSHLNRAMMLFRKGRQVLREAECLSMLGDIALHQSKTEEARRSLERALPLYRRVHDPVGSANNLFVLAKIHTLRAEYESARECCEQALQGFRAQGSEVGEANCFHLLGELARRRSDLGAAHSRYEQALEMYRSLGAPLGEVNCLNDLGELARTRLLLMLSMELHSLARERARDSRYPFGEVTAVRGIGKTLAVLGEFAAARHSLETALALATSTKVPQTQADCRFELATLALHQGDREPARALLGEVLSAYRDTGDRLGEASTTFWFGELAFADGLLDLAAERWSDALAKHRSVRSLEGEAGCLRGLAEVALQRNQLGEAHTSFDTALAISRKIENRREEARCLRGLGDISKVEGNLDAARSQYESALAVLSPRVDLLNVGHLHQRLAEIATNDVDGTRHLDAAREAWSAIPRPDLIASLPSAPTSRS